MNEASGNRMETLPMPLDAMHAGPSGLDEFRLWAPREIAGMLRQLCEGNAPMNLNGSDGSAVSATLWSSDAERGSIGFAVEADDPAIASLLESQDVVVVGYLDSVKVQFDVSNLVLVRGARSSVLKCAYPGEIYRFQRRSAFRVRPLLRTSPRAKMRHSEIAEMQLSLRVLDVSIGGCALFLPEDVPPMRPGQVLNLVQIELDADTRISVNLRLQHVTSFSADAKGVRLGCEFVRTDSGALRSLQRFIDLTQKRGKLLALD
jgi:c-di-GMP-binding flagellar brake protein YcgR